MNTTTEEEAFDSLEFLYLLHKMGKTPVGLIEQWELFNEEQGIDNHMNNIYGFKDTNEANLTFGWLKILLTKYGIKEFNKKEHKCIKPLAIKCFEILNDKGTT